MLHVFHSRPIETISPYVLKKQERTNERKEKIQNRSSKGKRSPICYLSVPNRLHLLTLLVLEKDEWWFQLFSLMIMSLIHWRWKQLFLWITWKKKKRVAMLEFCFYIDIKKYIVCICDQKRKRICLTEQLTWRYRPMQKKNRRYCQKKRWGKV